MSAVLPLRTGRLVLRNFELSDEERVHAFASDPVVTKYTDWGPNNRADSREFVRTSAAQASDPDRKAFNLAAVTSGVLIGSVAVWVENTTHRRGEIGFVFHPAVWNQGYATEAAQELIRFGFAELGLHRIAATCHPDNTGSVRALTKAGLSQEGRLRDHLLTRDGWRDSLVFAVVEPDGRDVTGEQASRAWSSTAPARWTAPG